MPIEEFLSIIKGVESNYSTTLARDVADRIAEIKSDRVKERSYMTLEELMQDERSEGFEEGLAQGMEKGLAEGAAQERLKVQLWVSRQWLSKLFSLEQRTLSLSHSRQTELSRLLRR